LALKLKVTTKTTCDTDRWAERYEELCRWEGEFHIQSVHWF